MNRPCESQLLVVLGEDGDWLSPWEKGKSLGWINQLIKILRILGFWAGFKDFTAWHWTFLRFSKNPFALYPVREQNAGGARQPVFPARTRSPLSFNSSSFAEDSTSEQPSSGQGTVWLWFLQTSVVTPLFLQQKRCWSTSCRWETNINGTLRKWKETWEKICIWQNRGNSHSL